MKKQDLKDFAFQAIIEALNGFDVFLEESNLSEKDKQYILNIFKKEQAKYNKKIKDRNIENIFSVDAFEEYISKKYKN
jgi:2-oxoglutarate dehydrogenase complex dehydrogenase (E1) component-like enzyme